MKYKILIIIAILGFTQSHAQPTPDSCRITSLPYVQDFSTAVGSFVPCWFRGNNTPYPYSYIYVEGYGVTGCLHVSGFTGYQYVALPEVDSGIAVRDSLVLFVDYGSTGESSLYSLEYGTMTDTSDFDSFSSTGFLPLEGRREIVLPLGLIAPGNRVAFRSKCPIPIYNYETVVDRVPPCGWVYNARCADVGGSGAFITWDWMGPDGVAYPYPSHEGMDTFTVELFQGSIGVASRVMTTTGQWVLLSNLTPSTSYRAVVSAGCNDTQQGRLHDTVVFITRSPSLNSCISPTVAVSQRGEDSISIVWSRSSSLSDTAWNIYLSTGNNWTLVEERYMHTSYTFHNLTPGTNYQILVNPICNVYTTATPIYASTVCGDVGALPWTEDFDGVLHPACWRSTTMFGTTLIGTPATRTLRMERGHYYSLPRMEEPVNILTISGKMYMGDLIVGVVKDDGVFPHPFIPLDTITDTNLYQWKPFAVDLSSCPWSEGRITLKCTENNNIDNLVVELTPSCATPYWLHDSAVTANSVTVWWDVVSAAPAYEVEYGPHGFAHGDGITVPTSSAHLTLTSLRHSSNYDVYVRSVCGGGDTSEWSPLLTFSTLCRDISSLPWTEDFSTWEPGTQYEVSYPVCWSDNLAGVRNVGVINCRVAPGIIPGDTTGYSTNALAVERQRATNPVVSFPQLSRLMPLQGIYARLTAWCDPVEIGSEYPSVAVGVSTYPANSGTFVAVDTIPLTEQPSTHEILFSEYSDTGRYITLMVLGDYNPYNMQRTTVYLDDIVVDLPPWCLRPDRLTASNVSATQAQLFWRERGDATLWQVVYGTSGVRPPNEGDSLWTGTLVTTSSNSCLLSGLLPDTEYEVYVRSICDTSLLGDTEGASDWSFGPLTFSTQQNPATVPYFCNFDDTVEAQQWGVFSNNSLTWQYGIADSTAGSQGYVILSPYIGLYRGITNAALYRDIDFGAPDSVTGNQYIVTLRTKALIPDSMNIHALLCIEEPSQPLVVSQNFAESPWGRVGSLHIVADSVLHDSWTCDTIHIADIHGVRRVALYLSCDFHKTIEYEGIIFSQTIFDDMNYLFDNIEIIPTPCPSPYNVETVEVTDSSATLTWQGSQTTLYAVTWGRTLPPDYLPAESVTDTVATNSINLTSLVPAGHYYARIQRLCDSGRVSLPSPTVDFTVLLCDSLRCDTVAADTTHSRVVSVLPVALSDSHSYSQQIIPTSYFSGNGVIQAVNLNYTTNDADTTANNYLIFLGHTEKRVFRDENDLVDPDSLSLVYCGPLPPAHGWSKIILNAPFAYDGVHNLVMAVSNQGNTFKPDSNLVELTSQNTSILLRNGSAIDAGSRYALSNFTGLRNLMPYRNQAVFDFCPVCSCPTPRLNAPILQLRQITLRWHGIGSEPGETAGTVYRLDLGHVTDRTIWDTTVYTTDTFFLVNNISPNQYIYRVRQICTDQTITNWAYGQIFIPPWYCPAPQNLHVADYTFGETTLQWSSEEGVLNYLLIIHNSLFDTTITAYDTSVTVRGLNQGFTYKAAVRAQCSSDYLPGEWSDTLLFTTAVCPSSSNLTYSNLQENSVVFDWQTEGENVSQWEIQYGQTGFTYGSGTSVIADHHPYTLSGLTENTNYDAYVRSICSDGIYSEHWSNKINFTTRYSDINSQPSTLNSQFSITPNPARNSVTITLNSQISTFNSQLILRDATGRELLNTQLLYGQTPVSAPTFQFSISNYPSGVYFATLVTPQGTATLKLIIKN